MQTKKIQKAVITNLLYEVYRQRLIAKINESDVVDKEGNILLSKDLKVKDKKSGYEYTVFRVDKTSKGFMIILRSPDSPRFDVANDLDVFSPNVKAEKSKNLVVTQKDFEKNFEVE
jgi:hypothetical protein